MGVFEHFPYSNFHEMNLDWILGLLKKWEDIADNIGEMVDEAVEKGLSELNIEEMITNILINYEFAINVKNPPEGLTPAKGDGTTDDTAAINGCVNYAAGLPNGGIVFFPQGLYLTDTVTLPSNVTLMGLSKHNVKLVKKASANSTFIGGNGSNNAIYGLTLDGNQVSSTVQVNGFIGMPVDMEIRECSINNCGGRGVSWSGTNLVMDSVEFEGSGINCLLLNGDGNVSVKNVLFKSLSEVAGDGVIVVNSDNCDIDFKSIATCNKCLVLEGENNHVHCRITGATIPVTDNGSGNSVINVVGDYKIGADNLQVNVSGDTTVNGQDVVINGTQHVDLNGADIVLNPINPLTYKTPENENPFFKYIEFKDQTGVPYKVAVIENPNVGVGYSPTDYGAAGDGIADDTSVFNNIKSLGLLLITKPYNIGTIDLSMCTLIFGNGGYLTSSGNVTLSNVIAGTENILRGTGNYTFSIEKDVPVEWFGAVNSESVSSATAFSKAISSLSNGGRLILTNSYMIDEPVTIGGNIGMISKNNAVLVGDNKGNDGVIISGSTPGWISLPILGNFDNALTLQNTQVCHINGQTISGCNKGVVLVSTGNNETNRCLDNVVNLGLIGNTTVAIAFRANNALNAIEGNYLYVNFILQCSIGVSMDDTSFDYSNSVDSNRIEIEAYDPLNETGTVLVNNPNSFYLSRLFVDVKSWCGNLNSGAILFKGNFNSCIFKVMPAWSDLPSNPVQVNGAQNSIDIGIEEGLNFASIECSATQNNLSGFNNGVLLSQKTVPLKYTLPGNLESGASTSCFAYHASTDGNTSPFFVIPNPHNLMEGVIFTQVKDNSSQYQHEIAFQFKNVSGAQIPSGTVIYFTLAKF